MRRRHSKLRMGLRGRSGLLGTVVCGTIILALIYYIWSSYFSSPSRITLSSVQGLGPSQLHQWNKGRQQRPTLEEPPIGLNKEIEIQMANENWKKAKALQDHIDEERLAEEEAAQAHGKKIDDILKMKKENQDSGKNTAEKEKPSNSLFSQPDPLDGDYFSKLERIVHLDLKGAPPLVSYLEQLFPLLKRMGATGLLIEYEDMFPYSGNLSILASASAYSVSDLQRIHAAAQHNDLEIIPLVQTFGHMEFVLKFKDFASLREHEYTPQVITPVKEESYTLIFSMLEQVLKAHPQSRRIHLGCDEVYQLGQGQSNAYITSQHLTPEKLFLQHVVRVARRLKSAFPTIRSLIWDDWLRKMSYAELADSGLAELVEPVVWYYQHDIMNRVPSAVWDNYSKLFSGVWVASAFKGATGSAQILTNASTHIDNNLQWVSVMRAFGVQSSKIKFRGIIFTGWQRYDHFATLCELLPVGLPSLAMSLQVVKNGAFGSREMDEARSLLGCSKPLDLQYPVLEQNKAVVSQDCSFPGRDIFYSMQQLWGILEVYQRDRGLQERISGWMTDYHIRQGFSNPGQMKVLVKKLFKVILKLQELAPTMREKLLKVFDKFTVEEWMATNIEDRMSHLKDLTIKAKKLLEPKAWPARPSVASAGESSGMTRQSGAVQMVQPGTGQKVQPGAGQGAGHMVQPGTGQMVQPGAGQGARQMVQPGAGQGARQMVQPGAGQMGVQSGAQNVAVQRNIAAPQGPQSVSGRVWVNGVQNQNVNTAQNSARVAQQNMGVVRKQNSDSANAVGAQGGVLSQTFLGKSYQGVQPQGIPSGPSKMQNVDQNVPKPYPQNRQVPQSMNFQVVPNQRQQNLGQYVSGLQNAQKQLSPGQNLYLRNQNPEGLRVNQQQVQKPDNVQGPLKAKELPQMQPVPAARDQREQTKGNNRPVLDTKREFNTGGKQIPAREEGYPDYAIEDLRMSDRNNNQQKDTEFLDSFVGRRGRKENVGEDNEKEENGMDDQRRADNDYNAEEDDDEGPV